MDCLFTNEPYRPNRNYYPGNDYFFRRHHLSLPGERFGAETEAQNASGFSSSQSFRDDRLFAIFSRYKETPSGLQHLPPGADG
ncbi:MAG TPA: hypothetical protein VGW76_11335 [Pyrinomonadaceae bacterium]|nr:hypothetical protein [Pyrinomonadaceae bacterium]